MHGVRGVQLGSFRFSLVNWPSVERISLGCSNFKFFAPSNLDRRIIFISIKKKRNRQILICETLRTDEKWENQPAGSIMWRGRNTTTMAAWWVQNRLSYKFDVYHLEQFQLEKYSVTHWLIQWNPDDKNNEIKYQNKTKWSSFDPNHMLYIVSSMSRWAIWIQIRSRDCPLTWDSTVTFM